MAGSRRKELPEKVWRFVGCCALMALLSVSALARDPEEKYPAAPVIASNGSAGAAAGTVYDLYSRLEAQRIKELSLLDEVIAESADESMRSAALEQKRGIAERMELETMACAVLAAMGEEEACVSCGAGIMTVFLPYSSGADKRQIVAVMDAVSEQTGLSAESVKIILVKNET